MAILTLQVWTKTVSLYMKSLTFSLLSLLLIVSVHAAVPTPESAMTFHMEKDPRKWISQYQNGSKAGIMMEFDIKGDSIKSWKEMVAHQIAFTRQPLRKYVDAWKSELLKADPKVEIKEETNSDDSILETYTSPAAQEMSMRRFIKGKDGIYMLAYHVRPKLKNEETLKIWSDIIQTAELIPNPEKKK